MKKTAMCVVALSLATVTGCTRVVEVRTEAPESAMAAEAPVKTQAPSLSQGDTYLRRQFLGNVESIAEVPIYLSDDEQWELGLATCEAVANGATAQEIVVMITTAAEGDQQIIDAFFTITASAIAVICPKYGYIFDNLT